MTLGDRIKILRKERKITQEQLAEYLNVSAQAVSKWETGLSYPDIEMLPQLALYFQTTVDALLDFDRKRIEKEIEKIVEESVPLRKEPTKAEAFYREALKRYPNNEVLLNCLLMVIDNSRSEEKIEIAELLLENTSDDEIKYDVLRLLVQMYHHLGQDSMAEHYLEQIPELYFLKTEIAAAARKGADRLEAIQLTEKVCFGTLLSMLLMRKEETADTVEVTKLDNWAKSIISLYQSYGYDRDSNESIEEEYQTGKLLDFYR